MPSLIESTPRASNELRETVDIVRDAWCPGNATRYELVITRPMVGNAVLVWQNATPRGGGLAFTFNPDEEIDLDYLMGKMGIKSEADGAAILAWLGRMGIRVHMPGGFNEHGCYTGKS